VNLFEHLLGIDPDGGSGLAEIASVALAASLVVVIIFRHFARHTLTNFLKRCVARFAHP
jgi:hypothetical protein